MNKNIKSFKNKFLSIFITLSLIFNLNIVQIFANEKQNVYEQSLLETLYLIEQYFISPTNKDKIVEKAMEAMLKSLGDKYSEYYTKEEYTKFLNFFDDINVELGIITKTDENENLIIDEVLEKSYASNSGLKKGDKILSINNKLVKQSNIKSIISEILLSKNYNLELKYLRNGVNYTTNIKIDTDDIKTVVYKDLSKLPGINNPKSNIAYIKISVINKESEDEFFEALMRASNDNKNRLILDLRGNGGGLLETAINISKMIVPKGDIISVYSKNGKVEKFTSTLQKLPFEKIAVLTDENTASSAEIITSAIKDSKIGFTVGQKTYGKGLIQGLFDVKTGGVVKLTIAEYFTRNGTKLNDVGITPNIPIKKYAFVDKSTNINSQEFIEILDYIGYKSKKLSEIQKINNLPTTNKLDTQTISLINDKIYKTSILKDDVLKKAYEEIIK